MPSDSNGIYALPSGYQAITGETIQASQHNPPLEDLVQAMTGRLPRNGAAPMTGPLKHTDGSAGAPSSAFSTSPTTGRFKTDDGIGWSLNGTLVMELKSTGLEILGTPQFVTEASIADKNVTLRKLYHSASTKTILARSASATQTITGASDNGAGLVRLTVASTADYSTGKVETVSDVLGTTEANGTWTITVVDGTHIDLQGSAFANTWVSGGTIGGGFKEIGLSELLDFVTGATRGDLLVRGVSTWNRVARGAQGTVIRSDGVDIGYGNIPLLHVRDQRAQNSNGDTAMAGNTWTKRTLQTSVINEITDASLASSQITLPAGTYEIDAGVMLGMANNGQCKLRLYNTTDASAIIVGMSEHAPFVAAGLSSANVTSRLKGRFTLAATKVLEVQGISDSSAQVFANNFTSTVEVYADVLIRKVG